MEGGDSEPPNRKFSDLLAGEDGIAKGNKVLALFKQKIKEQVRAKAIQIEKVADKNYYENKNNLHKVKLMK